MGAEEAIGMSEAAGELVERQPGGVVAMMTEGG
jgi:hypothetical protein